MNRKKFNLFAISKTRDVLFGISTLWIMFFHSYISFENILNCEINHSVMNVLYILLTGIRNIGSVGVEIFLFLSGVGLFFSFSKDSNLKKFYFRRFIRVLPESFVVAVIWGYYKLNNIPNFVESILFIEVFINGKRLFWFISFIMLLYLIYPIIYKVYNKYGFKGFVFSLLVVLFFNTILKYQNIETYERIKIMLSRLPIFLIGCYAGKYIKNKYEISCSFVRLSLFSAVISGTILIMQTTNIVILPEYIKDILFILLSLSIILINSYIFEESKSNVIGMFNRIFSYFGKFSIEMYLLFEKIDELLIWIYYKYCNSIIIYTFVVVIACIIISYLLKVVNKISKKMLCRILKLDTN